MLERIYIAGPFLCLRELEAEDITDDMMEWFQDMELMRFYTNSGRRIDRDALSQAIRTGKENGDNYTLGIYHNESGCLIGTVKLGHINWRHRISDLATLIGDRRFYGKGLASEAVALGTRVAFEQLDLRALHTSMYMSNVASIKAYRKAGWIIEGRIKGYYIVDGKPEDQILEGCYNPKYFSEEEIRDLREKSKLYYEG